MTDMPIYTHIICHRLDVRGAHTASFKRIVVVAVIVIAGQCCHRLEAACEVPNKRYLIGEFESKTLLSITLGTGRERTKKKKKKNGKNPSHICL